MNERSMELLLLGPFVPCVDFSLPGAKNFSSEKVLDFLWEV